MGDIELPPPPASTGLLDHLRDTLATLLALANTRLELAGTELEDALARLGTVLMWSAAALCAGILTLLLIAVTVIIAFWDRNRLLAAIVVTVVMAALAVVAGYVARARMRGGGRLFAETIAEFRRDATAMRRQ
jgi:uncharacterized membrane protein YqjE